MNSVDEQIESILKKAADKIRLNFEEKGINATGNTSAAIKVRQVATGFQLGKFSEGTKTAPLHTVEIGRPGGKVPRGFKYIIWDWMDAKGISTGDAKKDAATAGAIAYGKNGIKAKGTKRHKEQPADVYSTVTKETLAELSTSLRSLFATQIRETIKTNF